MSILILTILFKNTPIVGHDLWENTKSTFAFVSTSGLPTWTQMLVNIDAPLDTRTHYTSY